MAHDDVQYIPFQVDTDESSSAILQMGNCFIMDTEAVRSYPLLELRQRDYLRQQEPKKGSQTERMTCARNNIREDYFVKAASTLERQKCKTLQKLQESCSKLRHEVKLQDVDRLRHEMDVRKRLDPDKDYSCECARLENSSRRLDTGVTSCYLEKRMRYPTRRRSLHDTPTVRKARENLHKLHKSLNKHAETKSVNTESVKPASNQRSTISRRSSRHRVQSIPENDLSFSSKNNYLSSRPSARGPTSLVVAHSQYTLGQGQRFEYPPHIKSHDIDRPINITAGNNEKMITRYSFISDQLAYSHDSSDEEDPCLPNAVDLSAHFFSQRLSTSSNKPTMSSNNRTLSRKLQDTPYRLLAGSLQNEASHINSKVLEFLKNFPVSKYRDRISKVNDSPNSSQSRIIKDNATNHVTAEKAITNMYSHNDSTIPDSQSHPIAADDQTDKFSQPNMHNGTTRQQETKQSRYSWKLIKGTLVKDQERRSYTANDLVLQALTGIPISNILASPVPLHAASRAMRHTATFKMHKIMEKLATDRTRYQKYEMEELKRVMEEQNGVKPGAISTL